MPVSAAVGLNQEKCGRRRQHRGRQGEDAGRNPVRDPDIQVHSAQDRQDDGNDLFMGTEKNHKIIRPVPYLRL